MVEVAVLVYLFCCVQNTAGDESIILQEVKGSDLTISTGITGVKSNARIQWFYGPEKVKEEILISQVFMGIAGTEISSERFKGRVQLDRSSGDLTINNISISDSGLYTTHITAGRLISRTFNLSVYAPVSTPEVTRMNQTRNNQTRNYQKKARTMILGEFCSFMCSVRNGRDVNLSWSEENKIIKVTSNPDLRASLNLPLIINPANSKTFICVAANPVSKETVSINIAEICSSKPDVPDYRWIPILLSVLILLILAAGAAGAGFWVWRKKKKKQEEPETTHTLTYAEVNLQSHQAVKKEENSSVTDQEQQVLYASVKKSS
ncbi:SLAM family member 9-like [Trichomycterus rosablanca]|uniref:SLAM family member 9-like n=1 Tax=Trichomycterus rosablanca TaxID=2290929 RepID=UPI002F35597E